MCFSAVWRIVPTTSGNECSSDLRYGIPSSVDRGSRARYVGLTGIAKHVIPKIAKAMLQNIIFISFKITLLHFITNLVVSNEMSM